MQVTSDEESSAHDLMEAVLPDQSMCALILKIANSAFFGFPRKVSTIEKAVMVLGFAEIRNIVLGKAVFNCFQNIDKNGNRVNIENFWEHSFLCGLGAKIIAEDLGHPASELFIGGLLHDIGKLAMLMTFGNEYNDLIAPHSPKPSCTTQIENEHFGIGHDQVALKILKKWLFPAQLSQAIGYHHTPLESPASPTHPAIIQMADILALCTQAEEITNSTDIYTLLQDFSPEILTFWEEIAIPIDIKIHSWFEEIPISREKNAAILEIFSS